jgi:hypothetical protein
MGRHRSKEVRTGQHANTVWTKETLQPFCKEIIIKFITEKKEKSPTLFGDFQEFPFQL